MGLLYNKYFKAITKEILSVINILEDDDEIEFTITPEGAMTVTNVIDGGLSNLIIEVNNTAVNVPFTIVNGDVVKATFDAATSDTLIKFEGNA